MLDCQNWMSIRTGCLLAVCLSPGCPDGCVSVHRLSTVCVSVPRLSTGCVSVPRLSTGCVSVPRLSVCPQVVLTLKAKRARVRLSELAVCMSPGCPLAVCLSPGCPLPVCLSPGCPLAVCLSPGCPDAEGQANARGTVGAEGVPDGRPRHLATDELRHG